MVKTISVAGHILRFCTRILKIAISYFVPFQNQIYIQLNKYIYPRLDTIYPIGIRKSDRVMYSPEV